MMGFAGALPILLASAHSAETPNSDRRPQILRIRPGRIAGDASRDHDRRTRQRGLSSCFSHSKRRGTFKKGDHILPRNEAKRQQIIREMTLEILDKPPPTSGCRRAICSPCGGRGRRTKTANCAPARFAPARFMRASGLRNSPSVPSGPAAQAPIQCRRTIYRAFEFFCACNWCAASAFACHCCASSLRPSLSSKSA